MGFAAGFQVGQQAVERAEQRKREEELRRGLSAEAGRYNVTEGAYGPGLQENIQQLEGLRANVADPALNTYDPQQLAAYDQGIVELTRRQSLTAPDYSVASGAKNYDTRQEARQAAAPMRTEGLAGVYRQYGDVVQADALEARALEQQRGLTAEERAKAAEERAKAADARTAQEFATRQTLTGLEINQRLITDDAQKREAARQKDNAAWWTKQTTDPDTGERRAPRPEDFLAASQRDASSYFQTGDYAKGGQAYDAFMQRAEAQVVSQEKDRKRAQEAAFSAVLSGNYKEGMAFYNKFLPNGSIATDAVPGKDGMITVKHKDLSGNPLPDTKVSRQQLLEGIASFGDSKQALAYIQQSFANNIQTKELGIRQESLKLQQKNQDLQEDTAAFNKAQGIADSARKDEVLRRPVVTGIKTFKNQAGEAVLVDTSKLEQNADGTLKLPKGLTPATSRTEPTDAAVAKLAADIMKDRKQWSMQAGKLVAPSPEQAGAMARSVLRKNAAVVDENESAEDKLIRLMRASQQAQ